MLTGEDIRDMHSDPAEKTFKLTTEPLMFFLLRFGSEFLVDVVLQKKAALARHNAGLSLPDEEDGTANSGSYDVLSSSTTTPHAVSADQFSTNLLEITTALLHEEEKASTLAAASAAAHAAAPAVLVAPDLFAVPIFDLSDDEDSERESQASSDDDDDFDVKEIEQFGDTDDEIIDAKEEDIGDERCRQRRLL